MSGLRHRGPFEAVVIVGSQGALPAAQEILGALPADFPAAVVYVQHRVATAGSLLCELMRHRAALPVRSVCDGDRVEPGTLYVPPPANETVFDGDGRFVLREGRCMGDPLLFTAADAYGPRCVGVVLSGRLDDGAAGVARVKEAGGRVLVQAPRSAQVAAMPLAAMATGCYDFVLEPRGLAAALIALVTVTGAAELLGVRSHPLVAAAQM